METEGTGTLMDFFEVNPLAVAKPLDVTAGHWADTIRHWEGGKLHPAIGAYMHYAGSEISGKLHAKGLRTSPLSELAYTWGGSCGLSARYLLHYLFAICMKELRHGGTAKVHKGCAHLGIPTNSPEALLAKEVTKSGSNFLSVISALKGTDKDVPVADFLRLVEAQYRHGGWGGAYGGPKWANITKVVLRYVTGEISALMACDRAWTLVHNTGPIFNKGFMFLHHGSYCYIGLKKVLDYQAGTSIFCLAYPKDGSPFRDELASHVGGARFLEFLALAHKLLPDLLDAPPPPSGGVGAGNPVYKQSGMVIIGPVLQSMKRIA